MLGIIIPPVRIEDVWSRLVIFHTQSDHGMKKSSRFSSNFLVFPMCQGGSTTKFPLKQLQHHCVSWKPRGSPFTRSIARLDYKRVSFKHLPSSFFQAIHVVIARLRHMEPLRWLVGSKTMSNPWLLHGYDGGSFSEKLTELKSLVKPAIHGYSKKKLTISNFNQNTKICLTPIEQSCKNHQERPDLERHGTGGGVHGKRNDDPHGRGGLLKFPPVATVAVVQLEL